MTFNTMKREILKGETGYCNAVVEIYLRPNYVIIIRLYKNSRTTKKPPKQSISDNKINKFVIQKENKNWLKRRNFNIYVHQKKLVGKKLCANAKGVIRNIYVTCHSWYYP